MSKRTGLALILISASVMLALLFPVSRAMASVELDDGSYLVNVTLEGGSGRASVDSPATVEVRDGKATATIVWSSPNYDYMVVDGVTYQPVNTEGNSVFEIPVEAFDEPLDVIGDTTAMSVPHEIDYQLTFDSASAKVVAGTAEGPSPLLWACAAALVAVGVVLAIRSSGQR